MLMSSHSEIRATFWSTHDVLPSELSDESRLADARKIPSDALLGKLTDLGSTLYSLTAPLPLNKGRLVTARVPERSINLARASMKSSAPTVASLTSGTVICRY